MHPTNLNTYGGPVTFRRVIASSADGSIAQSRSQNTIWVFANARPSYIPSHVRIVVHELGHSFNQASGRDMSSLVGRDLLRPVGDHTEANGHWYGFAGGWEDWQFGWGEDLRSEAFADMFLGWTYNSWDYGYSLANERINSMDQHMGPCIVNMVSW